eukprot:TRINITY_DN35582_c0_g1_i1.p1 TRINITY_DN35582_c0_g1~~TRINITY_DN35582_c0_g1_i1.p1  ORF type:complete len:414 (-),score=33.74 TRINITY_DN35582_c0_g1_i1:243-1427(-)
MDSAMQGKRPAPDRHLCPDVEVTGAPASWLNQTYTLQDTSVLDQQRSQAALPWSEWLLNSKGKQVYVGSCESPKGKGSFPYIWFDWRHKQCKIATLGFESSHYICYFPTGGNFPEDLGNWRAGPRPKRIHEDFPESYRVASRGIKVRALHDSGQAECASKRSKLTSGADMPWSFRRTSQEVRPELAYRFVRDGYVILRAGDLGTCHLAKHACRAANIALRDAVECRDAGAKLNFRDYSVKPTHAAWRVFADLCKVPALEEILVHFAGALEGPRRCQLATIFPEGRPDDDYIVQPDSRQRLEYHIDGRGQIPNGFTLLVGIALNDQSDSCNSWGGLTVFPGSHRRSDLHKVYPSQKRGELQGRLDLGEGKQLHLAQGDAPLRIGQNRFEVWRTFD